MKTNQNLIILLFMLLCIPSFAQKKKSKSESGVTYDEKLYSAMTWRNIGPFRGGRSTTSSGVVGDPMTYYLGSVGGGVWKTDDAGINWRNISDGFFNATSIGAISVAESDPNVIYVGTGEACIRGVMTSHGDGVYKSTDAGKTWTHIGLDGTSQISEIRIHPNNPDIAYVAAQGSPYVPTSERGIYKTVDGGKNWKKVHFVDNSSGANNLSMDMNNPRILYAAYWDHQRKPWFVRSGGEGSGIYKTTDGGETWKKLTEGLPKALMGKIGVSVSRANSNRVFAVIESEEGGFYRSDDGGEKWTLMNKERILRTRSWYYMHVFADPKNENVVYVLNAPFMKSIDGGKSFTPVGVPHGDNHDLWINPENPENMINSNDGGANVSFNGGKSWSTQTNQPTAQFYRVNADNRFPYWVYGGQQDNTTVATPSRTDGFSIDWQDWIAGVGGGEAAHVAFNPDDPTFIYSSNITGFIDEYNLETGKAKGIKPYPVFDLGEPSDEMKYRYNWNPPVMVSEHNPNVIYYGSNVLHKSSNRGLKWEDISPNLTRNDTTKLGLMGGPITNEAAGGETYHTLMSIAESPHDANVIYAGADDGFLHITKDGGKNWKQITPAGEGIINSIDVSPHDPATVYVTVMKYKFNDFTPYIYKSTNYGDTWSLKTSGISEKAFARVVREDPSRKNLLYAGTESGIYISFDGGNQWSPLKLNLPTVSVLDLKVHGNDLLAATSGRAFWVLDNLTPLHQVDEEMKNAEVFLYKPNDVIKTGAFYLDVPITGAGKNPFPGASLNFYLKNVTEKDTIPLKLDIMDAEGKVLRTLSTDTEMAWDKIQKKEGMNVAKWDLRLSNIVPAEGVYVMSFANTGMQGYQVGPGEYSVKLTYGDFTQEQKFTVKPDPRDKVSIADINAQQDMLGHLYENIDDLYESLKKLQQVRQQVDQMIEREANDEDIKKMGDGINDKVDEVEGELISPKQETFQDVINFRNKLDVQLFQLMQTLDGSIPPLTNGEKELFDQLQQEWNKHRESVNGILNNDIPAFNNLLREKGVEYIAPKKKKEDNKEEIGM
uniref:VPS10 domain-containing protein n=1 Tax=Fulvivirga sp. TaxID=1931237 RepID=UPI00404B008C